MLNKFLLALWFFFLVSAVFAQQWWNVVTALVLIVYIWYIATLEKKLKESCLLHDHEHNTEEGSSWQN